MLDLDETFTEASERLFLMSTQTPGSSGTSVSSMTQEETWRTGGVLTGFLILDVDETFTEASDV